MSNTSFDAAVTAAKAAKAGPLAEAKRQLNPARKTVLDLRGEFERDQNRMLAIVNEAARQFALAANVGVLFRDLRYRIEQLQGDGVNPGPLSNFSLQCDSVLSRIDNLGEYDISQNGVLYLQAEPGHLRSLLGFIRETVQKIEKHDLPQLETAVRAKAGAPDAPPDPVTRARPRDLPQGIKVESTFDPLAAA
jgi:hypothetical protein